MSKLATTKLSSKGQVVIPEEIREALGLSPGTQFVVVGERDTVILKAINTPSPQEFKGLLKKARTQARKAGMKPSEVGKAIVRARGKS